MTTPDAVIRYASLDVYHTWRYVFDGFEPEDATQAIWACYYAKPDRYNDLNLPLLKARLVQDANRAIGDDHGIPRDRKAREAMPRKVPLEDLRSYGRSADHDGGEIDVDELLGAVAADMPGPLETLTSDDVWVHGRPVHPEVYAAGMSARQAMTAGELTALRECDVHGRKHADVAAEMGVSRETVSRRLSAARDKAAELRHGDAHVWAIRHEDPHRMGKLWPVRGLSAAGDEWLPMVQPVLLDRACKCRCQPVTVRTPFGVIYLHERRYARS